MKRQGVLPAGDGTAPADALFPVVAIGASAGGLEALTQFLQALPPRSGLAFVVIQHLDPTHKGILSELLQRSTRMPVTQIRDRMPVRPDHVYVIPPNKDISLLHGTLHLLVPATPRGLRLPIDFFFRSLAEDRQDLSMGVILSGMGSDGSLGLRAIKEKGGGALVQSRSSAKFDGMPASAIDTGLADLIGTPPELAAKVTAYFQRLPPRPPMTLEPVDSTLADQDLSALEKIIILLRAQTGHDFSMYKKTTLYRRIERRMGLHQMDKPTDYVGYLRENPQETTLLFKELLIGVTRFFRDLPVWEQLRDRILPGLLADQPKSKALRAWSVGCSTGEEAYSLAMVFREALDRAGPVSTATLQIFATDLDKDAIDRARAGLYPANIAADVSEERLRRFFVQDQLGFRVVKDIREMVVFAAQNFVMDPPFTRLDLLACRNLLIYLDAGLQRRLLPLIHYSLNPGGILLLGSSETTGQGGDLFAPIAPTRNRFYRRQDGAQRELPMDFAAFAFPPSLGSGPAPAHAPLPPPNLQAIAERQLLDHHCPTVLLTTAQGDLLYLHGEAGKYLELPAGRNNWNLFAMARGGAGEALRETFRQAASSRTEQTLAEVAMGPGAAAPRVAVTIQPLTDPEPAQGMVLVVFKDLPAPPGKAGKPRSGGRARALEQELARAREELQTTREEQQTSQEELKSTNEELQSSNEELQSINEELTTSKEEMQSMNEELHTVNQELQAKVDELALASNDMKNLLNSTDIATLFLDGALRVRRFTTRLTDIIKLLPGDAGRPITDIASQLDYPDMSEDAAEVMQTLLFKERQLPTRDGRWYSVRVMPYRTHENRIDGVVITFANATAAKNLERQLAAAREELERRSG